MNVSDAGRALIARNEGCGLRAYPDPASGGEPWTIGYGHTAGVRPGQRITQAEADQMLADDLATVYGPGVQAAIGDAPTTQAQFDAMVSLAFNIGVTAFLGSTVCRQHKAGNYQAAAAAFALWNKAGGHELAALTRRRQEEADMYLSAEHVVDPIGRIKRIQIELGVVSDGAFGRRSRAAMNELLRAAGQPPL